jgi:GT2 family glycosyltransferase
VNMSRSGSELGTNLEYGENILLRAQVAQLQRICAHLRHRMDLLEKSNFWRLRAFANRLRYWRSGWRDPAGDAPSSHFTETLSCDDPYLRWMLMTESREEDLDRLKTISAVLALKPSICIVVDDFAGNPAVALSAANAQIYPARVIRTTQLSSDPIRGKRFNASLDECSADFIAFCDANEALRQDATFEVALAVNKQPVAEVIYGDRDLLDPSTGRITPYFQPDWAPETFLSSMYTGNLIFYRTSLLRDLGGFNDESGTADHRDLSLRAVEQARCICHVSRVLYREYPTESRVEREDETRAVLAAVERRGENARVESASEWPCISTIRYAICSDHQVDIIVPTRDQPILLRRCLESVFARSTYANFKVTIVDNGSRAAPTHETFDSLRREHLGRVDVLRVDIQFNFSSLVNSGARSTHGDYIILLNDDTEVVSCDWIEGLIEQAQREAIGAVGARLLYDDGRLQHAGVIVGMGESAGHIFRGAETDREDVGQQICVTRNCSAVTAACMAVRRSVFNSVGGFNEALPIEFNDVDFCLRLLRSGLRNVYVPHVILKHLESQTRAHLQNGERRRLSSDHALFRALWLDGGFADPYYNRNLSLSSESAEPNLLDSPRLRSK